MGKSRVFRFVDVMEVQADSVEEAVAIWEEQGPTGNDVMLVDQPVFAEEVEGDGD